MTKANDDDDDQCLQNIVGRLFASCGQAGPEHRRGGCKGFWFRKRWSRVDKSERRSEAGGLQET